MARGPRPPWKRPPRILLVEDGPIDALVTRRAAERALACEIEVIRDGEAAVVELARRSRSQRALPDVVLLDLRLPGRSGLEVLRAIRGDPAYRLTPVIVLTTSGDDEAILECYAAGANSFLEKPATGERFAEALRVLNAGAARPAR
jgi:CheY-like chemotaxis protein